MNVNREMEDVSRLFQSGKWSECADLLWNIISSREAADAQRGEAYGYLGQICILLNAGYDGGFHGIGFFALALLHDPNCEIAKEGLAKAVSDNGDMRHGHIDYVLANRFREWRNI